MNSVRFMLACILLWGTTCITQAEDKIVFVRGSAARQAWEKPMQPRLDSSPLRETLTALFEGRRLAWMLDRRIDPDQMVTYTDGSAPLAEIVESMLQPLSAKAVFIGDTIIIGPGDRIQWLRTLAELQRSELQRSGLPVAKIGQLSRAVVWTWGDLAEPRQVAEFEARKLAIPLQGVDSIPYDLWGSGSLVGMTVGEAMTVIAYQYDQRLQWKSGGTAGFTPIQLPVEVSRVLPNFTLDPQIIHEDFPELHIEPQTGKAVEARGKIEDIEVLEKLVKGTLTERRKPKDGRITWRAEKYSLKVENAPVIEILKVLKQQGIPVEWNEKELKDAGVDLNQKISLEHKDATAEVLIQDLCRQAGIDSETRPQGMILKTR